MELENIIALITLALAILVNMVFVTTYFSKLSSRIESCENEIVQLREVDNILVEEVKTLHKIEGKLEILISHFLKKQ